MTTDVSTISVGDRLVGQDFPPYIIAEAGVHHQNSVELAKALALQARMSGADAIKFQTYKASELVVRDAPTYWADPTVSSQFEMFESRAQLSLDQYEAIASYCDSIGIAFLSTPFDLGAVDVLESVGVSAFKIASGDLTNLPLIERVCDTGKPLIISTGASLFSEVEETANYCTSRGVPFALLHCVLSYPTREARANLARIAKLQEAAPGCLVGYSDHTIASEVPETCPMAVVLGAVIIEKHFTITPNDKGDDHGHACDPGQMTELVRSCKTAWELSRYRGELQDIEEPARQNARRSIVARHGVTSGHVLTIDDLAFKRPGGGISPMAYKSVLGRTAVRDLPPDHAISHIDLTD